MGRRKNGVTCRGQCVTIPSRCLETLTGLIEETCIRGTDACLTTVLSSLLTLIRLLAVSPLLQVFRPILASIILGMLVLRVL